MIFLRPIIVTDAKASNLLTQDRYDGIRSLQEQTQPSYNRLLPSTGAPVLPTFEGIGISPTPALMQGNASKP